MFQGRLTMKHYAAGLMLALGVWLPVRAFAQEAGEAPPAAEAPAAGTPAAEPPPPPYTWKAAAELGLLLTTGNTKSTSLNAGTSGELAHGSFIHNGHFKALYTRSFDQATRQTKTSARRYELFGKSAYSLTRRHYLFGTGEYINDKFSGFEYQVTETGGYGIRIVDEEKVQFSLEGGPGGRHSKPFGALRNDDFIGRAALNFLWKISDTAEFTEVASTIFGPKSGGGIITDSTTALSASIVGRLALKVAFNIRYLTDPPQDTSVVPPAPPLFKKDIDTRTTVNLVYTFQ